MEFIQCQRSLIVVRKGQDFKVGAIVKEQREILGENSAKTQTRYCVFSSHVWRVVFIYHRKMVRICLCATMSRENLRNIISFTTFLPR
jgi:hypothetical protein